MNLVFDDISVAAFMNKPGNWRVSGFGDLAGNDTNFDTRRVRYFINIVAKTMCKDEARCYQNLSACLRPCTPDDIPIVGPLRHYPNVYMNAGLGGRATVSFATAKIVSELIEHSKEDFKPLVDGLDPLDYSPSRF